MKNNPYISYLVYFIPLGLIFAFFLQSPLENQSNFEMMLYVLGFLFFVVARISDVKSNFKVLFTIAVICRLIFFFIPPSLSPDYYRFIWDGELTAMGINPYAHTPQEIITIPTIYGSEYMRILYHNMTDLSKVHYSNYPVFNQFFYYIPAYFSDTIQGNVLGLRIIIFLADIGSIFLFKSILKTLKLKESKLWLYALNPYIIIEFTGNLHFEGVMIFFLLLSIYYVVNPKFKDSGWITSGIFLALSAQIKLIPLMFIPFYYKKLGWRKSLGFTAVTFVVFILVGLILWSNPVYFNNMMTSINDYFVSFEFNSSIFKLVNYFYSKQIGWDTTYIIGPLLSKIAIGLIILLAIVRNYKTDVDMIKGMMFALLIYYVLATTVHPWYISVLLALSVFTNYRFAFVWSMFVFLSYTKYINQNEIFNLILIVLEYLFVLIVFIRDLILNNRKDVLGLNFKEFLSN